MGYKSLIAGQVQNAMKILGTDSDGLAPMGTYVSVSTEGVYDPITRTKVHAKEVITGIPMTLVRFTLDDSKTADVKPTTDRKALIAALDLKIIPNETDQIITSDGKTYAVLKLMSDPSDSLHIIHIRFTKK